MLEADEDAIVGELNGVQGQPVDLGGYYRPDMDKVGSAMRPSARFNAALQTLEHSR
jgi:isocitrate dehydrogenase